MVGTSHVRLCGCRATSSCDRNDRRWLPSTHRARGGADDSAQAAVIIFLANNHGYTIEAKIHDGPYNDIKNWDYAGLLKVFNGGEGRGLGLLTTTGEELAKAIKLAIANRKGPTLIECVIDRDDCSPQLISWGRLVANANARPPGP
jgi:pyruvate decarboxylase